MCSYSFHVFMTVFVLLNAFVLVFIFVCMLCSFVCVNVYIHVCVCVCAGLSQWSKGVSPKSCSPLTSS